MKKYTVYQHPNGKTVAVKIGFCWPAFILSGLWAIAKKLWSAVFLIIFTIIMTNLFDFFAKKNGSDASYLIGALLGISVHIIFGLFGNMWLQTNLEKRGFIRRGSCAAIDSNDAINHVLSKT